MASGGKRKTLKKKGKSLKAQPATIPELRAAFEAVEKKAEKMRGSDKTSQIKEFQKTWRQVFGREISEKAVDAYLHVKFNEKKQGRMTRKKGKAQKGGAMPLEGAPLDYQTRPGIDGVHATYPAYVNQGLKFYDSINQIAMKADCGVKDFSPQIPKGMGSNQAGGAATFSDLMSAIGTKPFVSTVPSTIYQDMRTAYLGQPLPASPAVEDSVWKFK